MIEMIYDRRKVDGAYYGGGQDWNHEK